MIISEARLSPYYKESAALTRDRELTLTWSDDDKALFHWLVKQDEAWELLAAVFEERFNLRKSFQQWLSETDGRRHELSLNQKESGAFFFVQELREYGGHTVLNRFGRSPHYEDIVKQVHRRLARKFKAEFRMNLPVKERERLISSLILGRSMEALSAQELSELLARSEYAINGDKDTLKSTVMESLEARGIAGFKSFVGSAVARNFGSKILTAVWSNSNMPLHKRLGGYLKTAAPLALRRVGFYFTLALVAKELYDLGDEATRITNPAVITISILRSLEA